jgi:hypothetical protein
MRAGPMRPHITEAVNVRVSPCMLLKHHVKILTRKENSPSRAREMFRLLRRAHTGDVLQRVVQRQDLDEARKRGGDYLGHKHRPWGYLHVVPEFEVRDKGKRLRHSDVAECLEAGGISQHQVSRYILPEKEAHSMSANGRPG